MAKNKGEKPASNGFWGVDGVSKKDFARVAVGDTSGINPATARAIGSVLSARQENQTQWIQDKRELGISN